MPEGLERVDASQLHPTFRVRLERLLARLGERGLAYVVTTGYRSFVQQQQLFDRGRSTAGRIVTRARPGYSAHNWGLAADLELPAGSGASLSGGEQLALIAGVARGERLDPAPCWSQVNDGPHVQLDLQSLALSFADLLTVSPEGELEPVWSYLSGRID